MVIYKVHIHCLSVLEAEHHALVARHADAPLARPVALQRMQSETRRVRAPGMGRFLQPEQDAPKTRHQLRRESRSIIALMERPQSLVPDLHGTNCSAWRYTPPACWTGDAGWLPSGMRKMSSEHRADQGLGGRLPRSRAGPQVFNPGLSLKPTTRK